MRSLKMKTAKFIDKISQGEFFSPENFLLEKRIILLYDSINPRSAKDLITRLLYLRERSKKPITFFINSAGGRVIDTLILHDVIRSLPLEIRTIGMGVVASMAVLLLAAGKKGKRYLFPNTTLHVHAPFGRTEIEGTKKEEVVNEELRLTQKIGSLLKQYTDRKFNLSDLPPKGLLMESRAAIEKYSFADFVVDKSNLINILTNEG